MAQEGCPGLFLIVGQPGQGKTTLSKQLKNIIGCEAIHTDDVYVDWLVNTYPERYEAQRRYIRLKIRSHYPTIPQETQREWNEYITNVIKTALDNAKHSVIVEGWLMLYLPQDLLAQLEAKAKVLTVHMRHYTAHVNGQVIKSRNRHYANTIDELCKMMIKEEDPG